MIIRTARQGWVLMTAIYVMVILEILGLTAMVRSLSETSVSQWSQQHHHALFLAETSVDQAIVNLRVDNRADIPVTPLGGGNYWAEVTDSTEDVSLPPRRFRLNGHGAFGPRPERRDVEVLVQSVPHSVFPAPIVGDEGVIVRGMPSPTVTIRTMVRTIPLRRATTGMW